VDIIELATRRLEELRRSGIEAPASANPAAAASTPPHATDALLVRAARKLEEVQAQRPQVDGSEHGRIDTPSIAPPTSRPAARAVERVPDAAATSKTTQIDLERLQQMGYLTHQTSGSQLGSDFRVIKRQLLTNVTEAATKHANLIMVTSALPNEGKTFVAINLAMSMATEVDRRILLVDADVARPSMLSRLGLPPALGLLDILADPSIELSDVMLRTNIDKLTVLPAGAPREHATELLASETMSRLLQELSTYYPDRVVVFDAPPLLPSTESHVLATCMGQVILVVEAKHTPKKAVEQALATVESCPMVLPLLNKATRSEVGAYYGYYGLEKY
jgi:receptor protein-tyrosine kinase